MGAFDYDLIVIGAGSGGLATAKRAASYGARVAIAERDRVGGTCVIRGCIPKKLMLYASELGAIVEDAAGYGWTHTGGKVDWPRLVARRDEAVLALERRHEGHLSRANVELMRGHARMTGENEVEIEGRRLRTRYVMIATGSAPVLPPIGGVEHALTSDAFFELKEQPERVALVGGGYIAVEFASILNGLGTHVTLLVRRDLPLREFDEDLRKECLAALRAQGIDVRTNTSVEHIDPQGNGMSLHLRGEDGTTDLHADCTLVYAVGRNPRTVDLGLEAVGVAVGRGGELLVDEHGATSVPWVFGVGDVTARAPLTPVAIQAGRTVADRLFGGKDVVMSYADVPTAVFCEPPIATVGLTEAEAKERLGEEGVAVYKAGFTPLFHTLTERKTKTLVKLVVDRATDRVLGCHMIGRDAAEVIQGFAVAIKAGATKATFDATVGIHPSSAEEFVTLT
jgi:glutathione reductase (NADPH)